MAPCGSKRRLGDFALRTACKAEFADGKWIMTREMSVASSTAKLPHYPWVASPHASIPLSQVPHSALLPTKNLTNVNTDLTPFCPPSQQATRSGFAMSRLGPAFASPLALRPCRPSRLVLQQTSPARPEPPRTARPAKPARRPVRMIGPFFPSDLSSSKLMKSEIVRKEMGSLERDYAELAKLGTRYEVSFVFRSCVRRHVQKMTLLLTGLC